VSEFDDYMASKQAALSKQQKAALMLKKAAPMQDDSVPVGEIWCRYVPGEQYMGAITFIKLLREESDCTVDEAQKAAEAFLDGKALRFARHGEADLTSFVHPCIAHFFHGIQFGEKVNIHPQLFPMGQYAAAKIAAEADAADEPQPSGGYQNYHALKSEKYWHKDGLRGGWLKQINTMQLIATVECPDSDEWYAVPGAAGRQTLLANRQAAVQMLKEHFAIGLKPALRVLAALVGGRTIRASQVLPKRSCGACSSATTATWSGGSCTSPSCTSSRPTAASRSPRNPSTAPAPRCWRAATWMT
jgi:hypothetical protein